MMNMLYDFLSYAKFNFEFRHILPIELHIAPPLIFRQWLFYIKYNLKTSASLSIELYLASQLVLCQ